MWRSSDLLRSSKERSDVDVVAHIGEAAGNDLSAAIVAILTKLSDLIRKGVRN